MNLLPFFSYKCIRLVIRGGRIHSAIRGKVPKFGFISVTLEKVKSAALIKTNIFGKKSKKKGVNPISHES